ncbi:MAG: YndM family protein [Bacillota bacterium]
MKHLKAFFIKFTACFALLAIILGGIYGVTLGEVFLISVVLSAVSYAAGDLFLLPRSNNTTASLADFGLAFIIIWAMLANMTPVENVLFPSIVAAAGTAVFEFFYHKYLYRSGLGERGGTADAVQEKLQFQTETSEELAPDRRDIRNDEGDK